MFDIENKIKNEIKGHVHKNIIREFFSDKRNRTEANIKYIFEGYKTYQDNYTTFLKKEIFFESFFQFENKLAQYESFNDTVYKEIIEKKTNQIISRCFSKKHRDFLHYEEKALIEDFVLLGYGVKKFKENFSKKIALIKSQEEMKSALHELMDNTISWDFTFLKNKINKNNLIEDVDYKIIKNTNSKVFVKIFNFKAANALGSSMWCITRSHSMFNHYQEESNNFSSYVFEFNFNVDYSNIESNIAYLYDLNLKTHSAFYRNDEEVHNLKNIDTNVVEELLNTEKNSLPLFIERFKAIYNEDVHYFNFDLNDFSFLRTIVKCYENPFETLRLSELNEYFEDNLEDKVTSLPELYKEAHNNLNKEELHKHESYYNVFLIDYIKRDDIDLAHLHTILNHKDYIHDSTNINILKIFYNKDLFNEYFESVIEKIYLGINKIEKENVKKVFSFIHYCYENKDFKNHSLLRKLLTHCIKTTKKEMFKDVNLFDYFIKSHIFNIFDVRVKSLLFFEELLNLSKEHFKKESLSSFLINSYNKNQYYFRDDFELSFDFELSKSKLILFENVLKIKSEKDLECLNLFIFKEISDVDKHLEEFIIRDGNESFFTPFNWLSSGLVKGHIMSIGAVGRGKGVSRFYSSNLINNIVLNNLKLIDDFYNIDNKNNIQKYFNKDITVEPLIKNIFYRIIFENYLEADLKNLYYIFDKYNVTFCKVSKKVKDLLLKSRELEVNDSAKHKLEFLEYLNKKVTING